MLPRRKLYGIAAGCLCLGVCAGVAGAQVVQATLGVRYLNSGLFPLSADDEAVFTVSLDDVSGEPPAKVRLSFLDAQGAVVLKSNEIVLPAGHSASLRLAGRPGVTEAVRAHAEVKESTLEFTSRRTAVGSVRTINQLTQETDIDCVAINEAGLHAGRQ
jgi:hypothetical protein